MKPTIIGHRGNAKHAPENTRVSFVQAINAGATMVEMDTRLSRDEQIILMHDETVDRTTSATGFAFDLSARQLGKLDAGSWKDPKYRGECVPTLSQVADVCRGKAIMMLDLKCPGQGPALVKWFQTSRFPPDQVILAPWQLDEGIELRQLLPDSPVVLITETIPPGGPQQLQANGFWGISIEHQALTAGFVEETHRWKMKVYAWTVNEPSDLQRAAELSVDGIITDDPAHATRVLGS